MDVLSRIQNAPSDKIAIVHGDSKITYKELLKNVGALAKEFLEGGLGPGRAIGVEYHRSIACVVSWLAAWVCDAAFVAIDPVLPENRKEKYRDFCYLLADGNRRGHELDTRIGYVFLSSGSTGEPKAILMPATGVDNVIQSQIETFSIDQSSRVLWMLSPGFDASLSDVFTALCAGATLVIVDAFSDVQTFSKYLLEERVTHMDIPPSLLSRLKREDLPESLQTIIVGGEACSPSVLKVFAKHFRLVNCYGPTETTICSSMKVFGPGDDARNIGIPNPGFTYLIRDAELWIHGPGTAISYGGDIHTDRFVFEDGRRWFRTGDCVEKRGEDYFFLGRVDRQFKINGQLVNPEEIEKHLLENDVIVECRVEKKEGKLIAFCVAKTEYDSDQLLEIARRELPKWMIPRLVFVKNIPRNERGKIAINAFENQQKSGCVFQETMSEILGYEVDEHDDFWKVGGDSLMAFDFVQALSEKGCKLHIETLRDLSSPFGLRQINAPVAPTREGVLREADTFVCRPLLTLKSPRGVILLTGATGFLGRYVLDLLVGEGFEVVCIVRAENDEHAKARIGEKENIEAVSGDLLLPNWGLSPTLFQKLAERCDTVIHLAADLNLSKIYKPRSVHKVLNEMGRFFEKGIEKKMVYASTLSVFASTDFRGTAREDNFDFDGVEEIYGGYTAEKMLAESIVRKCFSAATILRFGLLTGDSQNGAFHEKNVLVSLIRTIVDLKKSVSSQHWRFDLTPVDYAAKALVKLIPKVGTFHVANSAPPCLDDVVASIENICGTKIAPSDNEDFLLSLHSLGGMDGQLARVAFARLNSKNTYDVLRSGDLFLASDMDFDGKKTQLWLASQGCKRLDSNGSLLDRYVKWSMLKEEK